MRIHLAHSAQQNVRPGVYAHAFFFSRTYTCLVRVSFVDHVNPRPVVDHLFGLRRPTPRSNADRGVLVLVPSARSRRLCCFLVALLWGRRSTAAARSGSSRLFDLRNWTSADDVRRALGKCNVYDLKTCDTSRTSYNTRIS